MSSARFFVSAAATGAGKTVVTASLAAAARARGLATRALKPAETGCVDGIAADALALAEATGFPGDAHLPGLHRGLLPLAPFAATLEGEPAPPPIEALARVIDEASAEADLVLIEGAGGLLVPYDATSSFADLAAALRAPLILVFPDELGVLHHALSTLEAAAARALPVAAVILVDRPAPAEAAKTNARTLATLRPGLPLFRFPWTARPRARLAAAELVLDGIISDTVSTRG